MPAQTIEREAMEQLYAWMERKGFSPFKQSYLVSFAHSVTNYKTFYGVYRNTHSVEDIAMKIRKFREIRPMSDQEILDRDVNRITNFLHNGSIRAEDVQQAMREVEAMTEPIEVDVDSRYITSHYHDYSLRPIAPSISASTVDLSDLLAEEVEGLGIALSNGSTVRNTFSAMEASVDAVRGVGYQTMKQKRVSLYNRAYDMLKDEKFPRPNFTPWDNRQDLDNCMDEWCDKIQYRVEWIFYRREREGFTRRNVEVFDLQELETRISKRKNPHPLDTETSRFYDWVLGGTDWTMRLEMFSLEGITFLISRFISNTHDKEVRYDVKYWTGSKFDNLISAWSEYSQSSIDSFIRNNFEGGRRYSADDVEEEIDDNGYYDYDDEYDGESDDDEDYYGDDHIDDSPF